MIEVRGRHPVVLSALGVAASFVLLLLLIWVLPDVLARGDFQQDADRMKAESDVRGNLVALVGAVGLLGGLGYTVNRPGFGRGAVLPGCPR